MTMKISIEFIKAARAKRVWTQQHLADVTDLSLRTIQRIESTGSCGAESTKAIAAAFDVEPDALLLNAFDVEKAPSYKWLGLFRLETRFVAILFSFLPLIAAPAIFLKSNNAVGSTEISYFEGSIRVDDGQPHRFEVGLRSEQVFMLDVDSRYKLVLENSGGNAGASQAKMRLLKNNGTSFNVLHSSLGTGGDNHLHHVAYRVCGEAVAYSDLSAKDLPDCGAGLGKAASP